jgi:hypothetical protein
MRKAKYEMGDLVVGTSLENKRIYGEWRGPRNSFGILIFGVEEKDTKSEPSMHVCLKLTIERQDYSFGQSEDYPEIVPDQTFKHMDPVKGKTKQGEIITGFYGNSEGKHAWIRGWAQGVSRFQPKQSHKVLANTLVKV